MFKVKIGISPNIMIEIFKFCDNNTHSLVVKLYNAGIIELMISGVQSISTLGAKIWDNQDHSTVSSKALKSRTQVTVLVETM